jgi:hypothetical protein
MTKRIIAKLINEFHSFLLIVEAMILLLVLLDKIKTKIIERATTIGKGIRLVITNQPIRYAKRAETSVVKPVECAWEAVIK